MTCLYVGASHVFQLPDDAPWLTINRHLCETCTRVAAPLASVSAFLLQNLEMDLRGQVIRCISGSLTWHVHQCEIWDIGGIDCQLDGIRRDRLCGPFEVAICLRLDLLPDSSCM